MKPLTLTQFAKRSRKVTTLIGRALFIVDSAALLEDATLKQLVIEKYTRVLKRLERYESNLRIRLQAASMAA